MAASRGTCYSKDRGVKVVKGIVRLRVLQPLLMQRSVTVRQGDKVNECT